MNMKRLFSLMVVALFGMSAMAQAVIKFEKTSINLGTFKEDKVQTCEFVFVNTGDKPLVVQQAFGSCGCTVATPPKDPIAPGAKGVIKVSYNGKGKFPGHFKKTITVRTNGQPEMTRLYIEGVMKEAK